MATNPPFLTYEVAASAYPESFWRRHDKGDHAACHSHAVNPATNEPFCRRIKRSSLLDDSTLITTLPPTCPACFAKLRKLGLQPPS